MAWLGFVYQHFVLVVGLTVVDSYLVAEIGSFDLGRMVGTVAVGFLGNYCKGFDNVHLFLDIQI